MIRNISLLFIIVDKVRAKGNIFQSRVRTSYTFVSVVVVHVNYMNNDTLTPDDDKKISLNFL